MPPTYGHRDTVTLNCLYILLELYLLQGLYVPCPCGTLFIAGAICPMPMWNFIYCRGYMSHTHVELYLLQGLYVPFPCETLFIAGAICPWTHSSIFVIISSPGHRPCELLSWVSVRHPSVR